jgi:hypothetical protein
VSKVLDIATMGAKVYVRSRDHCPPHVHVTHAGEGWEARLAFSYLDASIRLLDVVPLARAPRLAVLNTVAGWSRRTCPTAEPPGGAFMAKPASTGNG